MCIIFYYSTGDNKENFRLSPLSDQMSYATTSEEEEEEDGRVFRPQQQHYNHNQDLIMKSTFVEKVSEYEWMI